MTLGDIEMLPNGEYERWKVFYSLEPFGHIRDNIHAGMIASILVNQNLKKGATPYNYHDFMIETDEERREKKTREFLSFLKAAKR